MDIVIVGAGGHGKVVLDILLARGQVRPVGFVDADTTIAGTRVGGLPVLGPINLLPRLRQQKIAGAIVAIGDNRTRVRYATILHEHGFELVNAIHPTACISPTASIGKNVAIAARAVICTDAKIEDSTIINTAAVVDHECIVEEGAHICPGAILGGRVRIGPGAFVGLGANIIQCLSVGEQAIVGAGATVIRDIPDHATAVGVPARVIKVDTAAMSVV
jgi:UDP-perosamine 4-acetyltransferase